MPKQKVQVQRQATKEAKPKQTATAPRQNGGNSGANMSMMGQADALQRLPVGQRQSAFNQLSQVRGNQYAQQLAQQSDVQRKEGEPSAESQAVADKIPTQDIQYEIMAHHMGYQDTISEEGGKLLTRWGYEPRWMASITDKATGLFVGLIMPAKGHPELNPVVVFRGTEGLSSDVIADLDPTAVGNDQFTANQKVIELLINDAGGGKVDITGHSLGGALAQHAAAAFPGKVGRLVTFQAPAVTNKQAADYKKTPGHAKANHHIAGGDLVDTAGGTHLDGQFFRHTPGGGPLSHVKFLLLSPEFQARRESLGLDDSTLAKLGIKAEKNNKDIERYDKYPHAVKSFIDETVRSGLGTILHPVLSGIHALIRDDDAKIEKMLNQLTPEEIAKQHVAAERAYFVERLVRGITNKDEEKAILLVLEASDKANDLEKIFKVISPFQICKSIDGSNYQKLREFLQKKYYPKIEFQQARELMMQCINGPTLRWQEEMIADILTKSRHGRTLITQLGGKGGFTEGLNKIEWQLSGSRQAQVAAVFGKSGKWF